MTRALKQTAKKILPQPVINRLIKACDEWTLKKQARQNFDQSPLKVITPRDIDAIWADEEIEKIWHEDAALIKSLFGGEGRLEGVNPGDRRALYYLILALKPQNILEVGTHIGASTLHMARALKRYSNDALITTVDILDVNDSDNGSWKRVGLEKPPKAYAKDLDCDQIIRFVKGLSTDILKTADQQYDFIFLDGDHRASTVYHELSLALKALKPNGVLLLHDFYPQGKALYPNGTTITGPFVAFDRARVENPALKILPLGALPWPTKQGTNITSLALVTREAAGA